MHFVSGYLKAHVAGVVAALSLVIVDLNSGSITGADWIGIAGAFVGAAAAVAVVPNTPKAAA